MKTNHDDPYIMGYRRITIFTTIIFIFVKNKVIEKWKIRNIFPKMNY